MKCFICKADASEVAPYGDYKQLACPGCGEYKISGTAINAVENKRLVFNIQRSRDWLNSFLGTGQIPLIDEDKALGLQKI
jgi:pyruvate/2-oxoacid:ferredoxin oxidoreductase beta subunit